MQVRLSPNPIMIKELRSRMRGGRAFLTLTVVLVLMAAFSYVLYQLVLSTMQYSGMPLSPQIGQSLLGGLGLLLLMAIAAVAPAVTAGAISGEQEKLTYEMLLATPMRPASILWGKLVSALSYLFLKSRLPRSLSYLFSRPRLYRSPNSPILKPEPRAGWKPYSLFLRRN